jgi:hypothetical protein
MKHESRRIHFDHADGQSAAVSSSLDEWVAKIGGQSWVVCGRELLAESTTGELQLLDALTNDKQQMNVAFGSEVLHVRVVSPKAKTRYSRVGRDGWSITHTHKHTYLQHLPKVARESRRERLVSHQPDGLSAVSRVPINEKLDLGSWTIENWSLWACHKGRQNV